MNELLSKPCWLRCSFAGVLAGVLMVSGCSQSSEPEPNATSESRAPAAVSAKSTTRQSGTDPSSSSQPVPDLSVVVKSIKEVEQLVAENRGKVVVLDVWAMW